MSKRDSREAAANLTRLLWSPTHRVGRTGLTLGAVVEAAVSMADRDGLASVTMRRLADDVGVGTMTLYEYVPGRNELLQLMLDRVAAEVYTDRGLPGSRRSLRRAVEHIASANWDHLMQHRWVCEVPPGRPVLGPGEVHKYELELRPLDRAGLADHDLDALLSTVLGLTAAAARWQITMADARDRSGLSDEEWWEASAPVLEEHLDESTVPVASRVGTTVASAGDPRRVLDFGLAALVDAVEARLAST